MRSSLQEEEMSRDNFDEKRQALLESNGHKGKKKYKTPNLIKPFFIVFNVFAYMTYVVICVYCKQRLRLL